MCAHDPLEKPGGFLEDVLFLDDNVVQCSWFKDIEHPMLPRHEAGISSESDEQGQCATTYTQQPVQLHNPRGVVVREMLNEVPSILGKYLLQIT